MRLEALGERLPTEIQRFFDDFSEDEFTHTNLTLEGEVGNKKVYDPRSYGKKAERNMADRIMQACEDLRSTGTSLGRNI